MDLSFVRYLSLKVKWNASKYYFFHIYIYIIYIYDIHIYIYIFYIYIYIRYIYIYDIYILYIHNAIFPCLYFYISVLNFFILYFQYNEEASNPDIKNEVYFKKSLMIWFQPFAKAIAKLNDQGRSQYLNWPL